MTGRSPITWVAMSALAHGALIGLAVWQARGHGAPKPAERASVEVQLVQQSATQKGAPPAPTNPEPTPEMPPEDAASTPPAADAPPGALAPEALAPAALAPAALAPDALAAAPHADLYAGLPMPAPAPPRSPVNLGDDAEDRDALRVTGDDVVSEGPDARYHNLPPRYPADAARAHRHGAVSLMIHITPEGLPGLIEVMQSSGVASLDAVAQEAVALWRFKPAQHDGAAVASVYLMRFNFREDARP